MFRCAKGLATANCNVWKTSLSRFLSNDTTVAQVTVPCKPYCMHQCETARGCTGRWSLAPKKEAKSLKTALEGHTTARTVGLVVGSRERLQSRRAHRHAVRRRSVVAVGFCCAACRAGRRGAPARNERDKGLVSWTEGSRARIRVDVKDAAALASCTVQGDSSSIHPISGEHELEPCAITDQCWPCRKTQAPDTLWRCQRSPTRAHPNSHSRARAVCQG
jgi:hypothetical protein